MIDAVLEHSSAEYVHRPHMPAESPTLGLTHLQFEALLTAAKQSPNRCDFALVTRLGLLGLRIFEATGSDIDDLVEEHGHQVSACTARQTRSSSYRFPPAIGPAIERSRDERTAGPILRTSCGTRIDRYCATRRLRPGPAPYLIAIGDSIAQLTTWSMVETVLIGITCFDITTGIGAVFA